MPIYAYRCASCGHAKDVLQKLSDAPLTVCPSCGAAAFSKQVTAAGFQLKGSGWYATDFKNNPATKKADPDGGKTEGAQTSDAKTDSAKTEGAKTEGAKTDGTKTDAAKPATGASGSPKTDTSKSGDSTAPAKSGSSISSPGASTAPKAAGGGRGNAGL